METIPPDIKFYHIATVINGVCYWCKETQRPIGEKVGSRNGPKIYMNIFYLNSYYNIENKNAHRADSDTLATAKLFLTIKDKI